MERTASAKKIIAIEGCDNECAAACLGQAGFNDVVQVKMKDLGFEKGQTEVSEENVNKVVEQVKAILAD